jgi:hypothetical protein
VGEDYWSNLFIMVDIFFWGSGGGGPSGPRVDVKNSQQWTYLSFALTEAEAEKLRAEKHINGDTASCPDNCPALARPVSRGMTLTTACTPRIAGR